MAVNYEGRPFCVPQKITGIFQALAVGRWIGSFGKCLCVFISLVTLSACSTASTASRSPAPAPHAATDDRLDAILWQTTSAEYPVLVESIFVTARLHLERALADRQWTALPAQKANFQNLPPAIIMDVDETVIDTGEFQSSLVKNHARFSSKPWRDWQLNNKPRAVPGALDFIAFAQARGVSVFFITNRDFATEPATRKSLVSLGIHLPDDMDTILTRRERPDWSSDKESRRRFVAQSYRVVMVIGDDLSDFLSEYRVPTQARMTEAKKYSYWGSKWFMLPNPMYGSWESSLYEFNSKLSAGEISRRKFEQLR